ncbi:hypothetical protein TUMEXPCC7403_18250 [Tumidithrix helvetica PCC 7403]|uniref:hypothetical protein n=1 Tax=Tumidithrix helvetica TaxID=3457545 RepID=UPI003C9807B9
MNYRNVLLNIWETVAVYQVSVVLIVLLLSLQLGWKWAIAAFIIAELFHLKWWLDLKKRILDGLPEKLQLSQSGSYEFPTLDIKEWNQYTQMLETLGFEQVMDFKIESTLAISRLFADTQNHMFAEIFKIFSPNEPRQIICTFHSKFSDGWTFSSTTYKPTGFMYMQRHSRSLATYHPEIPISNLRQIHLKRRWQIVDDLGLKILTDVSWEAYSTREDVGCLSRREIFRRKNIVFALIEATLFELNPKYEWLGDYPKLAAQRKARGL